MIIILIAIMIEVGGGGKPGVEGARKRVHWRGWRAAKDRAKFLKCDAEEEARRGSLGAKRALRMAGFEVR